ncbi:MAG: hypothetical protein V3S49_00655 [Thermodesulfobacteriota bacterium]
MKSRIRDSEKIEKLFQAKNLFHKEMAKLSFEEKIEILVKLQKIADDIRSVSGKRPKRVWKI